jgi:hypothetical protein
MSNELALGGMGDKLAYAKQLAGASMLPQSYRGNPGNVLWAIEYGAALGIPPVVAIGMVHVMDGKPVASATMIAGLVRRAGHKLRVISDANRAVAIILRADDPTFEFRVEWTLEQANKAGLTRNPTWAKYPSAMLTARAVTACARMACPEALMGVQYTAEELGGAPAVEDLPATAPVAPVVVSDGRWADNERVAFCAALGDMGIKYDDAAEWSESLGKPRPSVMTAKMRAGMLDALHGSRRGAFDAWLAAKAPVVADADGVVDEEFFEPPQEG